eukprot:6329987-Amphidinium_carterae.1
MSETSLAGQQLQSNPSRTQRLSQAWHVMQAGMQIRVVIDCHKTSSIPNQLNYSAHANYYVFFLRESMVHGRASPQF